MLPVPGYHRFETPAELYDRLRPSRKVCRKFLSRRGVFPGLGGERDCFRSFPVFSLADVKELENLVRRDRWRWFWFYLNEAGQAVAWVLTTLLIVWTFMAVGAINDARGRGEDRVLLPVFGLFSVEVYLNDSSNGD